MSLSNYNKKRHFNETPEPEGKSKATKGSLKFVIQKHDASHLHYDLRLEMEGVLKSWALPKGPSLNTADKRLAMMVEDHPFDYKDFEGIIPEGNYGAGTVIVWDEGSYDPVGGESLSRKEKEKMLLVQLRDGNLKIRLSGEKIKGAYALFLMKARGERSWIFMKKADEHATKNDITKKDRSVKSGKTLAAVAKENGTVLNHPEKKSTGKNPPVQLLEDAAKEKTPAKKTKKIPAKRNTTSELNGFPGNAKKAAFPSNIIPMMATLSDEAFDDPEWIFEIKWDGYRALGYLQDQKADLLSRNNISFASTYKPVKEALERLKMNAVFDGEIVAVNEAGKADFELLQNWQNTPATLQYFIFDILWLNGYDLTTLPLTKRKNILQQVIPENDEVIRYSAHIELKGTGFFNAALKQGLEGIMAKKANSGYQAGARTKDWLKVKVNLRQEVVIGGFTAPRNTRKNFGSLMLGVYQGKDLVYVGHTGSGFDNNQLEKIYKELQSRIIKNTPFKEAPKANMPATWVKPELVCEIKFSEWTKNGMARHPIFMGLRTDKKPTEVKLKKSETIASALEKTVNAKTGAMKVAEKKATVKKTAAKKSAAKKSSKPAPAKPELLAAGSKKGTGKAMHHPIAVSGIELDLKISDHQEIILQGHELKLTNLNKLYWKKEKFSKGNMINYYLEMAPYMLPYLLDRPLSLNRHPNGIDAANFYQKDTKGKVPEWIQQHVDFSESTNKEVSYMVCSGEASLIYMANLGCIEMNPWHSRSASWKNPDWCLIDLDPDKGNSFEQVIATALVVKDLLDAGGAESCVKTSGSTGIHIYIPLGGKYSYDQSRQLAELLVNVVHTQLPDTTSVVRNPAKRKGLIYLDFLQNREIQTAAAPYCLRPKPGVPVSTPLHWSEVKKGLTQTTYNAHNIFERLKSEGDLFAPVLGKGIDLEKIVKNLASYLE